jgi:hypothetical protein
MGKVKFINRPQLEECKVTIPANTLIGVQSLKYEFTYGDIVFRNISAKKKDQEVSVPKGTIVTTKLILREGYDVKDYNHTKSLDNAEETLEPLRVYKRVRVTKSNDNIVVMYMKSVKGECYSLKEDYVDVYNDEMLIMQGKYDEDKIEYTCECNKTRVFFREEIPNSVSFSFIPKKDVVKVEFPKLDFSEDVYLYDRVNVKKIFSGDYVEVDSILDLYVKPINDYYGIDKHIHYYCDASRQGDYYVSLSEVVVPHNDFSITLPEIKSLTYYPFKVIAFVDGEVTKLKPYKLLVNHQVVSEDINELKEGSLVEIKCEYPGLYLDKDIVEYITKPTSINIYLHKCVNLRTIVDAGIDNVKITRISSKASLPLKDIEQEDTLVVGDVVDVVVTPKQGYFVEKAKYELILTDDVTLDINSTRETWKLVINLDKGIDRVELTTENNDLISISSSTTIQLDTRDKVSIKEVKFKDGYCLDCLLPKTIDSLSHNVLDIKSKATPTYILVHLPGIVDGLESITYKCDKTSYTLNTNEGCNVSLKVGSTLKIEPKVLSGYVAKCSKIKIDANTIIPKVEVTPCKSNIILRLPKDVREATIYKNDVRYAIMSTKGKKVLKLTLDESIKLTYTIDSVVDESNIWSGDYKYSIPSNINGTYILEVNKLVAGLDVKPRLVLEDSPHINVSLVCIADCSNVEKGILECSYNTCINNYSIPKLPMITCESSKIIDGKLTFEDVITNTLGLGEGSAYCRARCTLIGRYGKVTIGSMNRVLSSKY